MGISGLLPLLKPVMTAKNISAFRGKRVAVDGYAWLHKASYGCCVELCTGSKESNGWVAYCLNYIDMLLKYDIHITIVFDGAELPAKKATENERAQSRNVALQKGIELMQNGDDASARTYFARAVDITPFMAAQLMNVLRCHRPSVKFVVAPYEADSQLSFMSKNDIVDLIISEDSDTIPFGCKEVIFKLDRAGSCLHLVLSDIFSKEITGFNLQSFTSEMVIVLCVAAGCDYLVSLKGLGIKNSYKYISKHRSVDRVLRALRMEGRIPLNIALPPVAPICGAENSGRGTVLEYELLFYQAVMTFRHQIIFDVNAREARYLNSINPPDIPACLIPIELLRVPSSSGVGNSWSLDELVSAGMDISFLGAPLDPGLACGIADGFVDPVTHTPFNLPDPLIKQPSTKFSSQGSRSGSQFGDQKMSSTASLSHSCHAIKEMSKGIYQHFQSSSVATTARTSSSRISSAIGTCSYSVPALIGSTSHIASLSRESTTPIGANLYHNPVSFSSTSILRALKENSVSAPSATSGSVHPLPGSALQRTKTVSSFFQQKSTQPITSTLSKLDAQRQQEAAERLRVGALNENESAARRNSYPLTRPSNLPTDTIGAVAGAGGGGGRGGLFHVFACPTSEVEFVGIGTLKRPRDEQDCSPGYEVDSADVEISAGSYDTSLSPPMPTQSSCLFASTSGAVERSIRRNLDCMGDDDDEHADTGIGNDGLLRSELCSASSTYERPLAHTSNRAASNNDIKTCTAVTAACVELPVTTSSALDECGSDTTTQESQQDEPSCISDSKDTNSTNYCRETSMSDSHSNGAVSDLVIVDLSDSNDIEKDTCPSLQKPSSHMQSVKKQRLFLHQQEPQDLVQDKKGTVGSLKKPSSRARVARVPRKATTAPCATGTATVANFFSKYCYE